MSGPLSDLAEPSNTLLKLRHNVAYRNLWLAATVSDLGTEISTIAIPPVAVITLRASNVKVGLIASAQTVPFLLFSLPVGVWVDRIHKKLLLVGADIARVVLLLSFRSRFGWTA